MDSDLIVCPILDSYLEVACEGIEVPKFDAPSIGRQCRIMMCKRASVLMFGALNVFLPYLCEQDGGTETARDFRRFGKIITEEDINRFYKMLRRHDEFLERSLSRRGRLAVSTISSAVCEVAILTGHLCVDDDPCRVAFCSSDNIGIFISWMASRCPLALRFAVYEMLIAAKPEVTKPRRQLDNTLS